MIRRLLLSTLAFTGTLFLTSCSDRPENELVVGMELAYRPFEMTNEQNEPTGVSVDLAKALGKELGRPVRIQNIPFAGLIPALKTGKIDLIISSMTATEKRSESILFSDPYVTTGLCLLVSKNSDIQSIDDVDKQEIKVAVKLGTTGHNWAKDNLKLAEFSMFEDEAAAVLEVTQEKADAFIYDQMSTYSNWQKRKNTTRAILKPFQVEHWAIGLRHEDTALAGEINAFLKRFRESGGFDLLAETYLAEQKAAFEELGYEFIF